MIKFIKYLALENELFSTPGGLSLRGWWVVHEGWHGEGPRSSGVSAAARRRCGGRGTLQVGRRTTPSAPSHLAAAAAASAVSEHVHVVRLLQSLAYFLCTVCHEESFCSIPIISIE